MKESCGIGQTETRPGKSDQRCQGKHSAFRRRGFVLAGLFFLLTFALVLALTRSKSSPFPTATVSRPGEKGVVFLAPVLHNRQPQTLQELLQIPPDQLEGVDIAVMNLLCAEGLRGSEDLDIQQCLDRLDAWTLHVGQETKRNFHHFLERPKEFNNSLAYYRLGMLGTVLAEDLRIQYNPELERRLLQGALESESVEQSNAFFSSSRDVFIHGLLSGKHYGTCASMPFLYAAIARRLGYPVTIAARKYHLYIRYEDGNGGHLNMEATENLGFATPTDQEYRTGPFPMTQEEIDGCGWMRPLSNKEILGICLVNRANCLRSMKQYDAEIRTLAHAARYLPDTVLMKRVIEKNQELARNLHAADRWDELWAELEALVPPTAGPMFEHFQNRKLQVQFYMNQSTNLAEIEKAVSEFREDMRRFRNQISDDLPTLATSFAPPDPTANQQLFIALLADAPQARRMVLRQEQVPHEYWNGIPPELQQRLRKLTKEEEIVEELHVFSAEEARLRNLDAVESSSGGGYLVPPDWKPKEHLKLEDFARQTGLRADSIPWTYRSKELPPELQRRLAARTAYSGPGAQATVMDEIRRFEVDQIQRRLTVEAMQKRRSPLDLMQAMRPPLQIEIVPSSARNAPPLIGQPDPPNLPLTPQPEFETKPQR